MTRKLEDIIREAQEAVKAKTPDWDPNEESQWTDRSVASDVILTPLLAAAGIILGVCAGMFVVEYVWSLI